MIIFVTKDQAQNFNNEVDFEMFSLDKHDLYTCHADDFESTTLPEFCQNYYGKSIYELTSRIDFEFGFRIQQLIPYEKVDVKTIDYKRTLKGYLVPVETILFGRTLMIKYFEPDKDYPENPSDIEVVREVWDHKIDEKFEVKWIDKNICWFKMDGSVGKTKHTIRVPLSPVEQGLEGPTRRERIVREASTTVQSLLVQGGSSGEEAFNVGEAFMESIQAEVDAFISRADNGLIAAIQNHPSPLMLTPLAPNYTVRDLVLSKLDYFTYQANGGKYNGSEL